MVDRDVGGRNRLEHFSIVPHPVDLTKKIMTFATQKWVLPTKRPDPGGNYQENYTLFYQSVNRSQQLCGG